MRWMLADLSLEQRFSWRLFCGCDCCCSFFRIMELINGNPAPFAICYTIGNVVSICGTCFLYGPWNQAKKMFALTRLVKKILCGSMIPNARTHSLRLCLWLR